MSKIIYQPDNITAVGTLKPQAFEAAVSGVNDDTGWGTDRQKATSLGKGGPVYKQGLLSDLLGRAARRRNAPPGGRQAGVRFGDRYPQHPLPPT